jgi:cell division protein FtsI (penicillin-binding protein 3)
MSYVSSPLLTSPTPAWRERLLMVLAGCVALAWIGRSAYIQLIRPDFYQEEGEKRYNHHQTLPANRGRILDRHGNMLAGSVAVPSIWVDPKEFVATSAERKKLALALQISLEELNRKVKDDESRFAWLKRFVDPAVAEQVLALRIRGVGQRREFQRSYPEGESAAHVVGFTNADDRGQEGIELAFEKHLVGTHGSRLVIKDRTGRTVEDGGEVVEPVDGQDVHLSIDSKIQFFAYQRVRQAVQEHKAQSGSVVVLDAKSGEVLALANYPSYDPLEKQHRTGAQIRNRALTDIFEPGSTMKPLVVGWALETKRVTPQTPINSSPGSMVVGGVPIRDSHPNGYLSVQQVIQKSSNVGTVRMAMQMTPKELWELYAQLGIGHRPNIEFPGAVTGRLRAYKTWRPIEQATMSYGYGLSVSLFQLAQAYTVFANDGELIPLSVLHQEKPKTGYRIFSPQTTSEVLTMLEMVTSPGGTATKAQTAGYSVGGKTGTAKKNEGRGYASNRYRAWFVGLAPVRHPRIVVAVMVDEPSAGVFYGGEVAAPVFSQVAGQTLRILGVPPDLEVKNQVLALRPDVSLQQESLR